MPTLTVVERRVLPALIMALFILVPAAACGGGNTGSSTPTSSIEFRTPAATTSPSGLPSPSAAASPSVQSTSQASTGQGLANVQITVKDIKFSTDKITVPHGEKVTIQYTNDDQIFHNIAFLPAKGASNPFFTADLFKGPNVTKTFTFTAPNTPGNYYFQCDVHPDQMNGQFVVT